MRHLIVVLIAFFIGTNAHTQYVYYGYPDSGIELTKGDIIIVNIPLRDMSCRFRNVDDFNQIVDLLENNKEDTFRIEMNYYGPSFIDRCSERLCKMFKEILGHKTSLKNYKIVNNVNRNPIFLSKGEDTREDRIIYMLYNSRLEISVE